MVQSVSSKKPECDVFDEIISNLSEWLGLSPHLKASDICLTLNSYVHTLWCSKIDPDLIDEQLEILDGKIWQHEKRSHLAATHLQIRALQLWQVCAEVAEYIASSDFHRALNWMQEHQKCLDETLALERGCVQRVRTGIYDSIILLRKVKSSWDTYKTCTLLHKHKISGDDYFDIGKSKSDDLSRSKAYNAAIDEYK